MNQEERFNELLKAYETEELYEALKNPYLSDETKLGLQQEINKRMATRFKMPNAEEMWGLVGDVAPHARRVLLYGPPGTGKSYVARNAGNPKNAYPLVVHSDLPAAELRGHFVPQSTGGLKWMDGPATQAWRDGGRLVLDEIDKAGDDALSFLLGVLDDEATAKLVLGTTGEIITPHKDFTVWATMNGEPEDLPPALQDRFPVTVKIGAPHPAALAALPDDLQALAAKFTVLTQKEGRIGIRSFFEFAKLRPHLGEDRAAALVFGERYGDVQAAVRTGMKADPR
jgi:hypothetical protein